MPEVSVVIPVHCEEAVVPELLAALETHLATLGGGHEVLVVDDGSTDNTWAVLTSWARMHPGFRGVRLTRRFGKEAALSAGLDRARGDAVVVMDGDMQHPPSLIPEMVRVWREEGACIVEAVKRHRGGESLVRRWGSRAFYSLFEWQSGLELEGATDFKLLDKRVVDRWLEMPERNLFFRGMTRWLGYRRVEVPFSVEAASGRRSRWSLSALWGLAVTGLTSFSSVPLRLVSVLGLVCLVVAVVLGTYALCLKLAGKAVEGFTTVIILQLFIASVLGISLGIIGEYVGRIYDEVKRRPRYIVQETIEATPDHP